MKVNHFLEQRSQLFWGLAAVFLVILLGAVDYLTGYEFAFSLFYLVPVSLVAWYAGGHLALVVSALCAISWFMTDFLAGNPVTWVGVTIWNTFLYLGFFLVVSFLVTSLKKAFDTNRELARQDYITGAVSIRYFYELAQMEISRSRRTGRPFTLAYLDLDRFKQINDNYGHSTGDRILRALAEGIHCQVRATDIFARMGGDEFALLMPETSQQEAKSTIDRIHQSVVEEFLKERWSTTFSLGVVTFIQPPDSVDEMLKIADQAMYLVKNSTRNGASYALYP